MIDDATGGQSSRAGTTEQQSEGVRVVVVVVVVVVVIPIGHELSVIHYQWKLI